MKLIARFAWLYMLTFLGSQATAWLNLLWPFPSWFRHTAFFAGSFSAIAFLMAFVAARVRK